MYLDSFAEVFSNTGFVVLVYVNRNLCESNDEPKQEIDPCNKLKIIDMLFLVLDSFLTFIQNRI